MQQDLKCWVLLGCEGGQEGWQLVQDLMPAPCWLVKDEKAAKLITYTFWDKKLAEAALRKLKQDAKEKDTGIRYRMTELIGQVAAPYKARKKD